MGKENVSTIIEKLKGMFKRSSALTAPRQEKPESFSSDQYDTGPEYRVMAWNARLLGMAFGFSMLVNVGLACALLSLFPLKETEHHLVTLKDSSEQVVRIQPLEKGEQGREELLKLTCRDYVIAREKIDHMTDDFRWAEQVRFLSSDQVWTDFWTVMDPKSEDSPLKKYQERKATRSVFIINTAHVYDDVFFVDWECIDTIKGEPEQRKKLRSILKVEMVTNKLKADHKHLNPIGFQVVKYQVEPIQETSKR